MAEAARGDTVQALRYALVVLETFLEPDKGIQGIGETQGLQKSRAFRILNTVERHRFVQRDLETKPNR